MPVLANQQDLTRARTRNDTHGAGMNHKLDDMTLTIVMNNPILAHFNLLAFVRDRLTDDFWRGHTGGIFCASRTGRRARMNLSICFSVMMNGGSILSTVS